MFTDSITDGSPSPANRLAQIGYPVVPQLIEAQSDDRFSRAVVCHRPFYFSHEIPTIGWLNSPNGSGKPKRALLASSSKRPLKPVFVQ